MNSTSPLAQLTEAIGSLGSLMAWLSAIALVIAGLAWLRWHSETAGRFAVAAVIGLVGGILIANAASSPI